MGDSKERAQAVLSRMREAYGVKTNVEFSELLNIPQPTISNWISRGNIPLRYVMNCSQETGKDLEWLLAGELANLSSSRVSSETLGSDGKAVFDKVLSSGGKAVLQRLLDAYGFSMQKELGDMLGLSSGTISTWVRRDYFPGDVVVACALTTGVSLKWLATGAGQKFEHSGDKDSSAEYSSIDSYLLSAGKLKENGLWNIDHTFIPKDAHKPCYIKGQKSSWIVDISRKDVGNGRWLLIIDGYHDIYDTARIPNNKLAVTLYDSDSNFICNSSDVDCIGQVIYTIQNNI